MSNTINNATTTATDTTGWKAGQIRQQGKMTFLVLGSADSDHEWMIAPLVEGSPLQLTECSVGEYALQGDTCGAFFQSLFPDSVVVAETPFRPSVEAMRRMKEMEEVYHD